MPDYQNGKIYSIRSHQTDKIYIGSTTRPLSQRLGKHRVCYNADSNKSSKHILQYTDYYIELIENFPCNTKTELEKKESEYIRLFKDKCVNVVYPQRTKTEYYQDNKDYINKKSKEYQENHKDEKKKYYKKYRQEHKDELKEKKGLKYDCECGGKYSHSGKTQHLKTNKHKTYLANTKIV
jgi:hypothetical protein